MSTPPHESCKNQDERSLYIPEVKAKVSLTGNCRIEYSYEHDFFID